MRQACLKGLISNVTTRVVFYTEQTMPSRTSLYGVGYTEQSIAAILTRSYGVEYLSISDIRSKYTKEI